MITEILLTRRDMHPEERIRRVDGYTVRFIHLCLAMISSDGALLLASLLLNLG